MSSLPSFSIATLAWSSDIRRDHRKRPDPDAHRNVELCPIFENIASEIHDGIGEPFRQRLQEAIQSPVSVKDEHFCDGRTVRNLFENAMRYLANRVVAATESTPKLISTFQPDELRCSKTTIEAIT